MGLQAEGPPVSFDETSYDRCRCGQVKEASQPRCDACQAIRTACAMTIVQQSQPPAGPRRQEREIQEAGP